MKWHGFTHSARYLVFIVIGITFPFDLVCQQKEGDPNLTAKEWNEDLTVFVNKAEELHKNLFHTMKKPEWEAGIHKLEKDISVLNYDETVMRFAQLGALIQDGHSGLSMREETEELTQMPVRFVQYQDGIYVRGASPKYGSAVGGKVLKIGNVSIDSAMKRVNSIVSHDPDNLGQHLAWSAKLYLNNPRILHGLGLSKSRDSADFLIEKDGKQTKMTMRASIPLGTWYFNSMPEGWIDARQSTIPTPLSYQRNDEPFWFMRLPDKKSVYFQFNVVYYLGNEPLLQQFSESLGKFIEENGVKRLVIDLRNNSGGDNTLLRPLLTMLFRSSVNYRGGLYVITGPATFSAAQNFVSRLENYSDPIFVGEPTSQNVNFFSDAAGFELPHSHLRFGVSQLWWQDKDPRDSRPATSPELAVDPTFKEYQSGTDKALELALTTDTPKTIGEILETLTPKDKADIINACTKYQADPVHKYIQNIERAVNSLGYKLLNEKKIQEALYLFEANTFLYPKSANTFDSYGEALALKGDKLGAITAYKKALELNPKNQNIANMINKLEKGN